MTFVLALLCAAAPPASAPARASTAELLAALGAPERDRGLELEALREKMGAFEAPIERFCTERCALDNFFRRLAALERGDAEGPVRIVHLGDSQIASDYITDVIRRRLSLRFGSGGRGFLFIDKPTSLITRGTRFGAAGPGWRVAKIPQPRFIENVYGFSGANFIAAAGRATSRFQLDRWTRSAELFYYATPRGGHADLKVDNQAPSEISLQSDISHGASDAIAIPPKSKMLTLTARGQARLFGVALENGQPGIVYDSIGIPGADFEYYLQTDEASFIDQLGRRSPALVVLMLGGAEVYRMTRNWTTLQKVEEKASEFIARVRAATPEADCLVIGPLSRGAPDTGEPRKQTAPVSERLRSAAKSSGCAFWSALDAMGGIEAAVRWQKRHLMNIDYVHPRGDGADLIGHVLELALARSYTEAQPPRAPLELGLRDVPGGSLRRTFAKLRTLENKHEGRVAILHLGASHTSAHLFTDEARTRLTERFGDAGRGFIELDGRQAPWSRARIVRKHQGPWETLSAMRGHSGIFGLTGVRQEGDAGASMSVDFCAGCPRSQTAAKIQLFYLDTSEEGPIELQLDGAPATQLDLGEAAPVAKVWSAEISGLAHSLAVRNAGAGKITLLGASVEQDKPGVVYDALGLPGATAFVADGFDKLAFKAQLEARKADLYVLFYGTNEASIGDFSPESYSEHYLSLLETLRSASPDAECLILSNSDRMRPRAGGRFEVAVAQELVATTLRQIAERAGCAYWSTIANMGGPGSVHRWATSDPPLAKHDHVHMTEAGYRALARRFVQDLLGLYDADTAAPLKGPQSKK